MNRWWDDADAARDVLGMVDGSDVVQGVGTAALGLHALSRAAVAPLAADTLVDATRLSEVLAEVDYAPVASAIARATEQVMGEASEAYGQMLAAELHAQGSAGAQQMVAQLTAAGVPMPLALERLSHVVGVPAGYASRFTEAMKADQVTDIVAADAGDRALMTYASVKGHQESRPHEVSTEVSKVGGFEEREHPRDTEGKFAQKPETPGRLERMARRARRGRREERAVAEAPQIPKKASLAELGNLLHAPVLGEQRLGQQRLGAQRLGAQRIGAGRSLVELKAELPAEDKTTKPGKATENHSWDLMNPVAGKPQRITPLRLSDQEVQVALVPQDLAQDLVESGGVISANLAAALGQAQLTTYSVHRLADVLQEAANNNLPHVFPGLIPIVIRGAVPMVNEEYDENGQRLYGGVVERHAKFDVTERHDVLIVDNGIIPGVAQLEDEAFDYSYYLELQLANPEDYEPAQGVGKADEMWQDHQHHQVIRDEEGQFASEEQRVDPRRDRIARRRRRARRVENAEKPAPIHNDDSLKELAALLGPARLGQARLGQQRLGQARTGQARLGPQRMGQARVEKPAPKPRAQPLKNAKGQLEAPKQFGVTDEGTAAFQSMRAVPIKISDFRTMFGDMGQDLLESTGQPIDIAPIPPYESMNVNLPKPKRPAESLDDWLAVGTGDPDIMGGFPDEESAKAEMERHNQQREAYGDATAPLAYYQRGENSDWAVVYAKLDGIPPEIHVFGDVAALRAMERREETLEYRLVPVMDSHSLALHYRADPKVMGDHAVPLVAVEVRFPDDEKH